MIVFEWLFVFDCVMFGIVCFVLFVLIVLLFWRLVACCLCFECLLALLLYVIMFDGLHV